MLLSFVIYGDMEWFVTLFGRKMGYAIASEL